MTEKPRLTIVPCTLAEANAFVTRYHRHNDSVRGHKFSVAIADEQHIIRGVAICGRPIARGLQNGWTLECYRNCTDGCPNAPSALYAACARAARALGYRKLITYTLKTEPGTSLKVVGFTVIMEVRGRRWNCLSRPRVDTAPLQDKLRWELPL